MSNNYYADELKGEREIALKAVKGIEADFQRHITSSHKDAPKNALKYANNMLATIYRIYRTSKGAAHYDIFVDIYVRILAPHLDADASPEHFKRLLISLRHLFLTITSLKPRPEIEKLYKCIAAQQMKWSDAEDFKLLLNIHGTYIVWILQSEAKESHKIDATLVKLKELFQTQSQKSELNALDLTNSFMESLKINSTGGCTLITTYLSNGQRELLFKAYFELLHAISANPMAPTITTEAVLQAHLKATYNLLTLDVSTNLEQKLALRHLQTSKLISCLKQHQHVANCIQFLCNLLKLSYVDKISSIFKEHYKCACEYFCKMIKDDKVLLRKAWFHDLLRIVYRLQISMLPTKGNDFHLFWEQMDDTLFAAHFYFLKKLTEALSYSTNTDLLPQHSQLTLATVCLETYSFMTNKLDFCNQEPFTSAMLVINDSFKNVVDRAKCIIMEMENNSEAVQIKIQKLNWHLTTLMTAAKNPSQARFFIELAQGMENLKDRLPSAEWLLLLRRLYQLGVKSQDVNTAAELHCCYIAESIATKCAQIVPFSYYSQMHFFYSGISAETVKQGNCLVQIYNQSKSVFKPRLQKNQKRLLHWLEGQHIFSYFKKDTCAELFVNFAMCSQAKYDFLLAVSTGKLLDQQSIKSKVQSIYELLKSSKSNGNSDGSNLSRMQELSLAHAAYLLWLDRNEKQITNLKLKDFTEDNLSNLLQEKTLTTLNVHNEMEMIEMALVALQAFKVFYEQADIEPIPLNEGGFIDWSTILEHLTGLATYFQISGYIDYAIEAWSLGYRIAKTIDYTQYCLRALTFLCEYNQFFDGDNSQSINVMYEVELMSSKMINIMKELPQMLKRHQHFTLIYLCQVAYLYATKSKIKDALTYLEHVEKVRAKLGRDSQYDIVLLTVDVVRFRILWKFATDTKDGDYNRCSLLTGIEDILDRLEDFVNISSVDATLFIALMLSATMDFADFIANRLCENTLNNYFAYCLKLSVDYGAAILTAKMLSKWAMINLQNEYLQRAEIKFLLIENMLGLGNPNKVATALKSTKKCATADNQLQIQLNSGMESVRKAAVVSPRCSVADNKSSIIAVAFNLKLNELLINQKDRETVQQPISHIACKENLLLWTRFILGNLRARLNFLEKHTDELERFYENCKIWLEKRQNSFHFKLFYGEILMSINYYVNFLRSTHKFNEAIEVLKLYLNEFANTPLAAYVDPTCKLNFQLQLEDTQLELLERKNRNLPQRKRPETTVPSNVAPQTPMNKTTRYAQLPVTTYKKVPKTTLAFKIYSDRKSPHKVVLPKSSTGKSLKFTESEEKEKTPTYEVIELLCDSDSEDEAEQLKGLKQQTAVDRAKQTNLEVQAKETKVPKTKKIHKQKVDQLEIEHSMKNLKINADKATNSDSGEFSPEPSTSAVIQKDENIFKTPISSLAAASAMKSRASSKRSTKAVGSTKNGSSTTSSGNSSDAAEEVKIEFAACGTRRLRSRQTAAIDDDTKASSSKAASSKRRPR